MKAENKKTLLLVEDEVLIAMGKQQELRKYGYNVITANTGEKAVAISRENHKIDLILMDTDLGSGIDGTVAAEQILKDRNIPVVFMSSHTEPEIVEKTEKTTSYGYVMKNSGITILDASIKMAFKLYEANEKLKISESRFRTMFNEAPLGIALIDSKSGYPYEVNSMFAKIAGRTIEEMDHIDWMSITHPDDIRKDLDNMALLNAGEIPGFQMEKRYLHKDGTVVWINMTITPIFVEDKAHPQNLCMIEDITERKQAEDSLRETRDFLENLLAYANTPIIVWDNKYNVTRLNQSFQKLTGILEDEALGKNLSTLFPEAAGNVFMEKIRESAGQRWELEEIPLISRQTGKIMITLWNSAYILGKDRTTIEATIAQGIDITKRKQAEELLAVSEKKFRVLYDSSPDMYASISPLDASILMCNETLLNNTGYSREEIIGSPIYKMYHNDCMEDVKKTFREFLEKGVIKDRELILKGKDGSRIDVSLNVDAERDEAGRILHSISSWRDITERKRVLEELKNSELMLQNSQKFGRIGSFAKNLKTGEVKWSDQLFDLFGLKRSKDPIDFDKDRVSALIHPEDRQEVLKISSKAAEEGKSYKLEHRVIHPADNQIHNLSIRGDIICNESNEKLMIGTVQDITERKKIETELEEYHQHLEELVNAKTLSLENTNRLLTNEIAERQRVESSLKETHCIIDQSPMVLFLWKNRDGWPVKFVSENVADILGYSADDFINGNIMYSEIIYREDLQRVSDEVKDNSHNGMIFFKHKPYRLVNKSEQIIWIEDMTTIRRDEKGNITHYAGVILDITERKKAEVELRKAKIEAEMASKAKSEFLANMSHDLRTPLNAILGNTQMFLRDKELLDQYVHPIRTIHQSGYHLLSMINDILDLSKIEAGKMESISVCIDFYTFLSEIAEVFKSWTGQKGLSFSFENKIDPSLYLMVDEKHLRQVLNNLLSNAVKFTESGAVSFRVSYSNIPQEEKNDSQGKIAINFEVRDTGIGIAEEKIESIFEPFSQEKKYGFKNEGTGLGLAISRKLVRIMGAELLAESTPGLGSSFRFELELTAGEKDKVLTKITEPQIIGYKGRSQKILIADDTQSNLDFLIDLLLSLGFIVEGVSDGTKILSTITEFYPDLVLTDIHIPKVTGFEVLREIRQEAAFDKIIFIAMSATVGHGDECIDAGFTEFLEKPIEYGILYDILCRNLNIEWIYKKPREMEQQTDDSPLIAPPKAELIKLLELEKTGNIIGIKNLITNIEKENARYIPFVREIRQFADMFQTEKIIELVNSFLSGYRE